MTTFDPINPILTVLYHYEAQVVRDILYNTGLNADWGLTEKESYSNKTKNEAYERKFRLIYSDLNDNDKYRAAYSIAEQLVKHDGTNEAKLNENLTTIGWRVQEGKLIPEAPQVREQFFPKGSQYDAYAAVKKMIQQATTSVLIQDTYIDDTIFPMLSILEKSKITIQLLTMKIQGNDFGIQGKKFAQQYPQLPIEIRTTKDFHDRFIIVDGKRCFHLGASIKDAGKSAFMASEVEDSANRDSLIKQVNESWHAGTSVQI